jgi:hypothetical protein
LDHDKSISAINNGVLHNQQDNLHQQQYLKLRKGCAHQLCKVFPTLLLAQRVLMSLSFQRQEQHLFDE